MDLIHHVKFIIRKWQKNLYFVLILFVGSVYD